MCRNAYIACPITTVSVGDGMTCSFWHDVWVDDEPLADRFPALFSHCTDKSSTLSSVKASGIHSLVPRLSIQTSGARLSSERMAPLTLGSFTG